MPLSPLIAFDLDGTITRCELLPRIAAAVCLEEKMRELTRRTLCGELSFAHSFRQRFAMLRDIPLQTVQDIVVATPLDADIVQFIHEHAVHCVVITGNLDVWVAPLLERIGCRFFASTSTLHADGLHLTAVLDKGDAIRQLRQEHSGRIIAVGESVNDIPMLREADTAIAFGGVHPPAPQVLEHTRHLACSGRELCEMLNEFVKNELSKIVA